MKIKVNKRDLDSKNEVDLTKNEAELAHYNELKEKLKLNFQKEIYMKIEAMKILKEIKDKNYYKLDGFKNFSEFIKEYKLARTQAYEYLKIANAMEDGLVQENFLIENGVNEAILFLRNKESKKVKKSNTNPIKPLRFQLKKKEHYIFYKKHTKFTSFLMAYLYDKKKEVIGEALEEFKRETK